MVAKFLFVFIFAISIHICNCKNGPSYFKAAVFESQPATITDSMTPAEIMIANLKLIETAAKEASKQGADIFITSEYAANPPGSKIKTQNFAVNIPNPQEVQYNPCSSKFEEFNILSSYSCMAKKYNMYIIANILDIHDCPTDTQTCDANNLNCEVKQDCLDDNLMYNTNVAFDRNGTLIARYHKNHLYFEFLDTPKKPEMITFQTDFGVFGLIVCFDSLFEDAVQLVKNHGVETLIFVTEWFDDILPFNAVEWEQAWSITNGVNFLAANKHVPGNSTLGSGIYSKDYGALGYTYNPDSKSKLLICDVPRHDTALNSNCKKFNVEQMKTTLIEEKETGEDFLLHCYDGLVGPPKDIKYDHRCYKFQTARHKLTKLEKPVGEVKSCDNNFCCSLKYEANSMSEDYYLTAFSGENDVYDYFKWNEQTCLLVRCDSFKDEVCALLPSKATTVFKSVELKVNFKSEFVYPTVSKSQHRLAPKAEWDFKIKNDFHILSFNSEKSDPLLKVGLFSRNYADDPPFIPYYKGKHIKLKQIY